MSVVSKWWRKNENKIKDKAKQALADPDNLKFMRGILLNNNIPGDVADQVLKEISIYLCTLIDRI